MQRDFEAFVKKEKLFSSEARVLLAVSGGLDSVVMSHLFAKAGFEFGIAHCNFKLRGEAADGDEVFVRKLSKKMEKPFYPIAFDTESFAKEKKISIQLAARILRYEWLEKIRAEYHYDYIATAHHLNDSIETFLYNFTKGCGIRGLHGIPLKNDKVIRPILFAARQELVEYAENKGITYREDASNASLKYERNKIRHSVVSVLKEINPALEKTARANFERIKDVEWLYDFAVNRLKEALCHKENGNYLIDRIKLSETGAPSTLLYEILEPLGFNAGQISQILDENSIGVGAIFHSEDYRLLVDRQFLIAEPLKAKGLAAEILINKGDEQLNLPDSCLSLSLQEGHPESFPEELSKVFLDFEKLSFPLKLRHWRPGDYFCPLGLNGRRKKLQDFFSDIKLNRFEKEKVWILETSKGEICWVVNYRLDDRFKISPQTNRFLSLSFEKR